MSLQTEFNDPAIGPDSDTALTSAKCSQTEQPKNSGETGETCGNAAKLLKTILEHEDGPTRYEKSIKVTPTAPEGVKRTVRITPPTQLLTPSIVSSSDSTMASPGSSQVQPMKEVKIGGQVFKARAHFVSALKQSQIDLSLKCKKDAKTSESRSVDEPLAKEPLDVSPHNADLVSISSCAGIPKTVRVITKGLKTPPFIKVVPPTGRSLQSVQIIPQTSTSARQVHSIPKFGVADTNASQSKYAIQLRKALLQAILPKSATPATEKTQSRASVLPIRPRPAQPVCVLVNQATLKTKSNSSDSDAVKHPLAASPFSTAAQLVSGRNKAAETTGTVAPRTNCLETPKATTPASAVPSVLISPTGSFTVPGNLTSVLPAASLQLVGGLKSDPSSKMEFSKNSEGSSRHLYSQSVTNSKTDVSLCDAPTFLLVAPTSTNLHPSHQKLSVPANTKQPASFQSSNVPPSKQKSTVVPAKTLSDCIRYISPITISEVGGGKNTSTSAPSAVTPSARLSSSVTHKPTVSDKSALERLSVGTHESNSTSFVVPLSLANKILSQVPTAPSTVGKESFLSSTTSTGNVSNYITKVVVSNDYLLNLSKVSQTVAPSKPGCDILNAQQQSGTALSTAKPSKSLTSDVLVNVNVSRSSGTQNQQQCSILKTRLSTASIPRRSYLKMLRDIVRNERKPVRSSLISNTNVERRVVGKLPVSSVPTHAANGGPAFVTRTLKTGAGIVSVRIRKPSGDDNAETVQGGDSRMHITLASPHLKNPQVVPINNDSFQTREHSSKLRIALKFPSKNPCEPQLNANFPPGQSNEQNHSEKQDCSDTDSDILDDSEEQDMRVLGQLLQDGAKTADEFNSVTSEKNHSYSQDDSITQTTRSSTGLCTSTLMGIKRKINERAKEGLELKIESVFSLNSSSAWSKFEKERPTSDLSECAIPDTTSHDNDKESPQQLSSVKVCFPVLERLSESDIDRLSSSADHGVAKTVGSQCSKHCRQRTLKYMCDLNILPCGAAWRSSIHPEGDEMTLASNNSTLSTKDHVDDEFKEVRSSSAQISDTKDRCVPRLQLLKEKLARAEERLMKHSKKGLLELKPSSQKPEIEKDKSSVISSQIENKALDIKQVETFDEVSGLGKHEVTSVSGKHSTVVDHEKSPKPKNDTENEPIFAGRGFDGKRRRKSKDLRQACPRSYRFKRAIFKLRKQVQLKRKQMCDNKKDFSETAMKGARRKVHIQKLHRHVKTLGKEKKLEPAQVKKAAARADRTSVPSAPSVCETVESGHTTSGATVESGHTTSGATVESGHTTSGATVESGHTTSGATVPTRIVAQLLPSSFIRTKNTDSSNLSSEANTSYEGRRENYQDDAQAPTSSQCSALNNQSPTSLSPTQYNQMSAKIIGALKSLNVYLRATGRQLSGTETQRFLLRIGDQHVLVSVPSNTTSAGIDYSSIEIVCPDKSNVQNDAISPPGLSGLTSTTPNQAVQKGNAFSTVTTPVKLAPNLKRKMECPVPAQDTQHSDDVSLVTGKMPKAPRLDIRSADGKGVLPQSRRSATLMHRWRGKSAANLRHLLAMPPRTRDEGAPPSIGFPQKNSETTSSSCVSAQSISSHSLNTNRSEPQDQGSSTPGFRTQESVENIPCPLFTATSSGKANASLPLNSSIIGGKILKYADPGSVLSHLPIDSCLLPTPNRDVLNQLSPTDRARKRALLEKKYPLPPGVVIKTELDDFDNAVSVGKSFAAEASVDPCALNGMPAPADRPVMRQENAGTNLCYKKVTPSVQNKHSGQNIVIDFEDGEDEGVELHAPIIPNELSCIHAQENLDEPPPLMEEAPRRLRRRRRRSKSNKIACVDDKDDQPPVLLPMCTPTPLSYPTAVSPSELEKNTPTGNSGHNLSAQTSMTDSSVKDASINVASVNKSPELDVMISYEPSTSLIRSHNSIQPFEENSTSSDNRCLPSDLDPSESHETPVRTFKATEVSVSKNVRIQRLKELLKQKEQEIETMRQMRLELPYLPPGDE